MGDWIQQLFQPDYNPIDQQFLSRGTIFNFKTSEAFFVQQVHSHDQTPSHKNQVISEGNYISTLEKIEEHTQEVKNQESLNGKSKRKKKPSKLNQQMGYISEVMGKDKCKKIKKFIVHNKNIPQPQYPTKNFLQNFKVAHLDFLQTKFSPAELLKNELFCRLKMKSGMAMQDYKDLYSALEFRQAFEQMFRSKYLYRSMMLSRSGKQARINHIKKMGVFEQSFRTKSFDRIN